MLPQSYGLIAAIALVLGGAVACFAGYRLFRIVLAIYGFIFGAYLASSTMGSSNAVGMLAAALVGGFLGSVVFFFAYFLGIALVGAGAGRADRARRVDPAGGGRAAGADGPAARRLSGRWRR